MHDKPGALIASKQLRSLLQLVNALGEHTPRSPTLDLVQVNSVETEIRAHLSDELLCFLAARATILKTATNISLDHMLEISEEYADLMPDDHVAIAVVYCEPFAELFEGAHGGPHAVLGIPRSETAPAGSLVVSVDRGPAEPMSLVSFARDRIEEWYSEREDWLEIHRVATSEDLLTFLPRLIGELGTEPEKVRRWVVHEKLGRGELLDNHDDKSRVRFASGEKVIKSSMLTEEPVETPVVDIAKTNGVH